MISEVLISGVRSFAPSCLRVLGALCINYAYDIISIKILCSLYDIVIIIIIIITITIITIITIVIIIIMITIIIIIIMICPCRRST